MKIMTATILMHHQIFILRTTSRGRLVVVKTLSCSIICLMTVKGPINVDISFPCINICFELVSVFRA